MYTYYLLLSSQSICTLKTFIRISIVQHIFQPIIAAHMYLKMLNAPIISIILELNRIKNNPYDSCAKCSVHYIQYNNTKVPVPSILTAKCNLLSITKSLQAIYRDFTELEYCNLALACCIYRNYEKKQCHNKVKMNFKKSTNMI